MVKNNILNIKKNFFGKNQVFKIEYNGETFFTDKYAIVNAKYINNKVLDEWLSKCKTETMDISDWIKKRFNDDTQVKNDILLVKKESLYQDKDYKLDVYNHKDKYYFMQHRYSIWGSSDFNNTNLYFYEKDCIFTVSTTKLIYCVAYMKIDIPKEKIKIKDLIQQEIAISQSIKYEDILE